MTTVQTPEGRKAWPFAGMTRQTTLSPRTSIMLADRRETYAGLYLSQPWVTVVVNKLARAIARLPLKTYVMDEASGDRAEARDHPAAILLSNPAPLLTTYRLKESIIGSMAVYGSALVIKVRLEPGAPPSELWPVDWSRVQVVTGVNQPIDYYLIDAGNGRKIPLAREDAIHFRWWGPNGESPSPLEPLRQTLAQEDAALRFSTSNFKNAVRPSGGLVTPARLRDDQKAELRAEMEAAFGGPDNAGKLMLLDGGLDWKPFGGSANEAQLIESRKLSREEVCAVYDIPPPMVGILDRATFSNVDEQHRMLYQDTFGPWLCNIEETLGAELLQEPAWPSGAFEEFLLDDVLRGDVEKRSAAYMRFLQASVYTPNELRKLENRPSIDHPLADAIYVPVNMRAVGEGLPEEAPLDPAAALAALLLDRSNGSAA